MKAAALVLAVAALVSGIGAAIAQGAAKPAAAAEPPPRWSALTPAQRAALQPLQSEWPTLDASRKQKWLVLSQRYATMPEVERRRLQERMAEWARLSPAARGRARENYQALRTLPAEERQALWEAYQALPPERKIELAARRAAAKPPPGDAKHAKPSGKRNIVPPSTPQFAARPVTPTMVQARPGATTKLVTRPNEPPAHNQPGLPKIAAVQGFVNPKTLLPNRGPQGAAVTPTPPATIIETAE